MTEDENDFPLYDSHQEPHEKEGQIESGDDDIGSQALGEDLETIRPENIEGPLVIFYGPRGVGKSAALIRLTSYIEKYEECEVEIDHGFRSGNSYANTIREFESIRNKHEFSPARTGELSFLLLKVTKNGSNFCEILEAPGEHFFNLKELQNSYPTYLNDIFQDNTKKVFVFFFESIMFGEESNRKQIKEQYASKIKDLLNDRFNSKRDKIIIVSNKADQKSGWIVDGRPKVKSFVKGLYEDPDYGKLFKYLRTNRRFGKIRFVPFSAGLFNKTKSNTKKQTFSFSNDNYPRDFWEAIHEAIDGGIRWKFW